MTFKDHFSGHADLYAKARPLYPRALFDWIAAESPSTGCVWDAGCGNGQASVALAQHFARVIATDPSAPQLHNAVAHPRIEYRNEPRSFCDGAYCTSIEDRSVDAVTVAQALHWFELASFAAEVRRVARPGALFAAWCYAAFRVTPEIDAVVARLYDGILGAYWTPERRLVEEGYASLVLPFPPVRAPAFEMRSDWNAAQWLAYLRSWSAAQRHLEATGRDAIESIGNELIPAWGDPEQVRPVRWTLALRAGRIAQERAPRAPGVPFCPPPKGNSRAARIAVPLRRSVEPKPPSPAGRLPPGPVDAIPGGRTVGPGTAASRRTRTSPRLHSRP